MHYSLSFPFSNLVSKSFNHLISHSVSQANSHSNLMVYNALIDSFIRLGIEYVFQNCGLQQLVLLYVYFACSSPRPYGSASGLNSSIQTAHSVITLTAIIISLVIKMAFIIATSGRVIVRFYGNHFRSRSCRRSSAVSGQQS